MQWTSKAPTDVLDYELNWTRWLGTDTIATSSWEVPVGVTKESESNSTKRAVIWLSGGTTGQSYTLTNTITTAGGRTRSQDVILPVV